MAEQERRLLSGNEAIALGAWMAGCRLAAAYPGTPSSEILPALAECGRRLGGSVYCEWSTNEKVALEVASGASIAGARSLATMKHVGLNVAADPFFTLAYTGVGGGLVVVCADDPGMASSQNEQDNRYYGRHAGVPVLEPIDSQEALEFTQLAFELSERFDLPILLRTTTRVSHSKSPVRYVAERDEREPGGPPRDPEKYVMVPGYARKRHAIQLEHLRSLAEWAEAAPLNREQAGEGTVGFITGGLSVLHLREVLATAPVLHLGMSFPLPERRIREFAGRFDRVIVVEELEPFLYESIRALGVPVDRLPEELRMGEMTPTRLAGGLRALGIAVEGYEPVAPESTLPDLPPRPPVLCPGCIHRAVFSVLRKLRVFVTGDIGCYTLATFEPLSSVHTCLDMGASISQAHGISHAMGGEQRVVAVIGDSTFTHMGIPALLNAVYNRSRLVCLILNNGTTAMTGGQEHPGTGTTLEGAEHAGLDFVALARALGVEYIREVTGVDLKGTEEALRGALEHDGPSVVLVSRPCPLRYRIRSDAYEVDPEACTLCRICLRIGCPAISLDTRGTGKPVIDSALCNGCGLCAEGCPSDAIRRASEGGEAR